MSEFLKNKIRWFFESKQGDKTLFYQPKDIPTNELKIIEKICKKYSVAKAFYTKLSVGSKERIYDYHLVGIEVGNGFDLENFLVDLQLNKEVLTGFKFFDLSISYNLAHTIKKSKSIF